MTEVLEYFPEEGRALEIILLDDGDGNDVCRLPGWAEISEEVHHQTSVLGLPLDEELED